MAVRSGGLHRSLCPAFFSWAISVTEIHTESGAAFPTDHVHQTPARKHAPPTTDRATVQSIRNVHDVDDGARASPTCGDGMLCVSTHDKQDPANGKRSSVQECDHFSPSVRPSGFPETCTPRPRIRDTTRRAKRRSPRRKAPRNPSRPRAAWSSVEGSGTHARMRTRRASVQRVEPATINR